MSMVHLRWLLWSAALVACGGGERAELVPLDASAAAETEMPDREGELATSDGGMSRGARTVSHDEALLYEGPPIPYLRVDLTQEGGRVRIEPKTLLSKHLVPSVNGELMLLALRDDEVLAAAPFSFSTGALLGENATTFAQGTLGTTSVVFPKPEGANRLEARNEAGEVLGTFALDALSKQLPLLSASEFQAQFPSIRLVVPGDGYVPPNFPGEWTPELSEFTPEMLDIMATALVLAPEASRNAVRFLVPVKNVAVTDACGTGPVLGATTREGTVLINTDYQTVDSISAGELANDDDVLTWTVVHESMHAFTNLIDSVGAGRFLGWPQDVRVRARALIDQHHLAQGLPPTWRRIQDTVAAQGFAAGYRAPCTPRMPPFHENGFATGYASASESEDIAELATSVQLGRSAGARRLVDRVCDFFAAQGATVTRQSALLYTKAVFARHLGLIDQDAFDACLQGIRVDAAGDGFTFDMANDTRIALRSAVSSGYNNNDGSGPYLTMTASLPPDYSAALYLVDREMMPLGLHLLSSVNLGSSQTAGVSAFFLGHTNPFRARTSQGGMVLVTESTEDSVSAIILTMALQNAGGRVTDFAVTGTFQWNRSGT